MQVEYHAKEGIDGRFFSCPAGMGVMSTAFCADSHVKSNTKAFISEHRRKDCRFCQIGAMHCGKVDAIVGTRLYGSLVCSRCTRDSNRLVFRSVCMSCYNRERENLEGKNAKGNPLKLIRHYRSQSLLILGEDAMQVRMFSRVMSSAEAWVSYLLTKSESVMFGESDTGLFV